MLRTDVTDGCVRGACHGRGVTGGVSRPMCHRRGVTGDIRRGVTGGVSQVGCHGLVSRTDVSEARVTGGVSQAGCHRRHQAECHEVVLSPTANGTEVLRPPSTGCASAHSALNLTLAAMGTRSLGAQRDVNEMSAR